jgi:uncharacterized protein with PIN domain
VRAVADAMLGRLARWLRALGHDVLFDEALHDPDLVRLALREHRLLLTRDRRLCLERGHPDWCLLVDGQRPAAQLRELDRRLPVFGPEWRDRLFTRCMVCNDVLVPAPYRQVRDRLPPDVRSDPRVSVRRVPPLRRVRPRLLGGEPHPPDAAVAGRGGGAIGCRTRKFVVGPATLPPPGEGAETVPI